MRKEAKQLGLLLMITYFVSYITRINYGAIIVEMVSATEFTKSELSLAITGAFFTYGAGQVISGFFGDRFQPKTLVMLGLCTTVSMNVLMPLCYELLPVSVSLWVMFVIWCINGFAQSFMWPPMVRLMVNRLTSSEYKRTSVIVSWGSSLGTIFVYLVSPLIITWLKWHFVFWFVAVIGIVMIPVWCKLCPVITEEKKAVESKNIKTNNTSLVKLFLSPLMITIMLAIVLQGILRDGVMTWMPSFVGETFKLGNNISILTGVILPIFSIISFRITEYVYERKIKNPLACAGAVFGVGAVSAFVLIFVSKSVPALSILATALLSGCMHGVNLILICMIPPFFKNTGKVSLVSGVLNACTYIGSTLSAYGFAKLSDMLGWGFTIITWFAIAALGTLCCVVCVPAWKRKHKQS